MLEKVKPISYYGGKQRLASWIIQHLPPHTVYVEPFCGGCSVMFKKGMPEITSSQYYREVINDSNRQLITMFKKIRDDCELERKLKNTLYSRAEHENAKAIWRETKSGVLHSSYTIAWAFFVNVHMSFASKLNGGWATSVYSRNNADTWYRKTYDVSVIRERLRYCHIECDDALKVIKIWDSPQTCFYIDPPYPGADQGHYKGYSLEDYQMLIDLLQEIQGSFVLSNYAQGLEPKEWQRVDKIAYASSSSKGRAGKHRDKSRKATQEELGDTKRIESLWIVDRSSTVRKELVPHMWSPSKGFAFRKEEEEEEEEPLFKEPEIKYDKSNLQKFIHVMKKRAKNNPH